MNEKLVAAMTGEYGDDSRHANAILSVLDEGKFADDLLVELLTTCGTLPATEGTPTIPGVGFDVRTWGTAVKENLKAVREFAEACWRENLEPLAVAERLRGFLDGDRVARAVRLSLLMNGFLPYMQRPAGVDEAAKELEGVGLGDMVKLVLHQRHLVSSVLAVPDWEPVMGLGGVAQLIAGEKDPKVRVAVLMAFLGVMTPGDSMPMMVVIERVKSSSKH